MTLSSSTRSTSRPAITESSCRYMLLSYARPLALSPCGSMAGDPYKRMALELDKALARSRDNRLQLGVDLELLDHVANVPLNRVRSDAKALGHHARVQAFREQVQNVQLSRCELRKEPFSLLLPGENAVLPADGSGEQLDRNQDFAPGRPANSLDDLGGGRIFGQVGRGAGVDRIQQRG